MAEATYTTVYTRLGLQYQTPEAFFADGRYRSLGYMRPLAIWSIQHVLSNLPHRLHIPSSLSVASFPISVLPNRAEYQSDENHSEKSTLIGIFRKSSSHQTKVTSHLDTRTVVTSYFPADESSVALTSKV
ncbi:unnamed protein product [Protopolystoma xenopodis]|uniref:Glycosyl-hydrolase family 116 catalytic region domain-containing protein n=1 Tax=Protopolystoma xenopodis TaxID=117903 RepID=A0A3S5CLL5_9PLAT|nr:unnamed protein product [Protopolystoma xenopodis]